MFKNTAATYGGRDCHLHYSAGSGDIYKKIVNEEPSGKPLGIFVGKEIYYTGGGSYPNFQIVKLHIQRINIIPLQAAGYEPPPSNQKTIYKEKLVKIPTPEFIVLYNGVAPREDYKELKLSDAFMDVSDLKSMDQKTESLEMTVKVYNINHGHNLQMLKRSETLNNYSLFIGKIREYQSEGMTLAEAVKSAIIYCTGNNILKNFLEEHGSEVINMLYQEYNLEEHLECRYEEGWEDGHQEGREKRDKYFLELLDQGLTTEEIKQHLKHTQQSA